MPQIDDPTRADASLLDRIKKLEEQQSAVPLGKVKFLTGSANPISPIITPTPSPLATVVPVPKFATSCAYSVFASAVGRNTTASVGFMTVKIEVSYGAYTIATWQSASNVGAGNVANLTVPSVDTFTFPPGGGNLTLTASVYNGAGSWTDTTFNAVWPEGLFVFAY